VSKTQPIARRKRNQCAPHASNTQANHKANHTQYEHRPGALTLIASAATLSIEAMRAGSSRRLSFSMFQLTPADIIA
jgi:hypothetical protein